MRDSGRRGRLIIAAALTFVVATGGLAAIQLATATSASAQSVLGTCNPTTIFNVAGTQAPIGGAAGTATGTVYALDVTSGVNTPVGRFPSGTTPVNGLAVTPDLSKAIAVAQNPAPGGQPIYILNQDGSTQTVNGPNTGLTIVMGGYDPANGIYYYAGYSGTGMSLMLQIYGFNPATNMSLGHVANVSYAGTGFSTGDLAFDSNGNMYVVAGTNSMTAENTATIRRVDGPLPDSAGQAVTLGSTPLATQMIPAGMGFYNGIAFGANGTLYAQYSTSGSGTNPSTASLVSLNASNGAEIGRVEQQGTPVGNSILTDLAGCSLPSTLTVQKVLPDGRAAPGDQFTMTVTGPGITEGNSATTTGPGTEPPSGIQQPAVGPLLVQPGVTYDFTEELAQGTTTSPSAYTSSWSCTNGQDGPGTSGTVTIPPLTTGQVQGANVVCTFDNRPAAPTLTLTKALGDDGRVNDTDQFTTQIKGPDGAVVGTTENATSTGSGSTVDEGTGTTTLSDATAGPYTLTEVGAGTPPADLANYTQDIECTDDNGVQSGLPSGTFTLSNPPTVTPAPGAAISCVLTNTPIPQTVLKLKKAMGSDRIQDSDQFTVAIRPGSPDGTPLTPEGNANPTTTGTGSTIDPNTGTTGFVPADAGTRYFLTETGDGSTNLAAYTSAVTCTDFAGLQTTGLPTDEPLSDNPSVTIMNRGSRILCTLTNTARQPTLTVNKKLGSDRVNAGDQFTTQILGSDQTTVVGDTANATTQGSGATVTDGTGTTTLSPATAGDTFFVNDVPAEGSSANAEQYTGVITCTDANGVQTGLPSGEPFEGPLQIMPMLGANITCTITNSAVAPGLILNKALGSDRVNDTDQFTMQITDPSGAVVGTTDSATTTGTGSAVHEGSGTTELAQATAGTTYTLTEVAAGSPPANPADYTSTISCIDSEGLQPGLPDNAPFSGSIMITPVGAASISCTVTNTAKPAPKPTPTTPAPKPTPTTPAPKPTPTTPAPKPTPTTPAPKPTLPIVPVTG